jgi:alpha-beta hydrolase superfamily lysophospholipase
MSLPIPLAPQEPGVPVDRWNRAAMEWVSLLRNHQFDSAGARVDPAVPAGAMGSEQLDAIWGQLSSQLGELRGVEAGPVTVHEQYHLVDLPAAFANQEVVLRVVLTDDLLVSGFFVRPPAPPEYEAPPYVDPGAFTEVEVTVGSDPWPLPGVLTLPAGGGLFPGVVLVHGSGPNDRDETLGGNRPFRDLAWGLASRGIAVLRYDKRTKVYGGVLPADIGLQEEVVEDALLALSLLRARREIDPARVFLLGHSLGAMLAPDIGRRDGGVAGVAVLAAPLRPFLSVLLGQLEYLASLEMNPDSPARAQLDSLMAQVEQARAGALGEDEPLMGVRRGYWRELEELDPLGAARRLAAPIFILQGGRDYQSTAEDFRLWEEGLPQRDGTLLKLYPSLSHLFTPGDGTATPEEYATQVKHVDPEVIRDLADWILEGFPRGG